MTARPVGRIWMDGRIELDPPNLVALAELIAREAHRHQEDKAGRPYIEHVSRVAEAVEGDEAKAVAWLHDVLEDTAVTAEELRRQGIPENVIEAVEAIKHRPHEPRTDYYARVRENELARKVKLADVADNSDPARLAALDEATSARLVEKYRKAREHLTSSV